MSENHVLFNIVFDNFLKRINTDQMVWNYENDNDNDDNVVIFSDLTVLTLNNFVRISYKRYKNKILVVPVYSGHNDRSYDFKHCFYYDRLLEV